MSVLYLLPYLICDRYGQQETALYSELSMVAPDEAVHMEVLC